MLSLSGSQLTAATRQDAVAYCALGEMHAHLNVGRTNDSERRRELTATSVQELACRGEGLRDTSGVERWSRGWEPGPGEARAGA